MTGAPRPAAVALVRAAVEQGVLLATAESLTGGLLCAALTDVPGASAVVRGAVVSYASDVKRDLLGVDGALLAREGAVHPDVAAGMASGALRVLGADLGLATTGVAGPDPSDGQPVGTVYVACALRDAAPVVRRLALAGSRAEIREGTVEAALTLALEVVSAPAGDPRRADGSGDGSAK